LASSRIFFSSSRATVTPLMSSMSIRRFDMTGLQCVVLKNKLPRKRKVGVTAELRGTSFRQLFQ
jgi:hypothetical protein